MVHRRDERGSSEEARVRTSNHTVGDLGWSGEDGAIYIVPRRNGIVAIVVGVFVHCQQGIVVVIGAIWAKSRQRVVAVVEAMRIVSR